MTQGANATTAWEVATKTFSWAAETLYSYVPKLPNYASIESIQEVIDAAWAACPSKDAVFETLSGRISAIPLNATTMSIGGGTFALLITVIALRERLFNHPNHKARIFYSRALDELKKAEQKADEIKTLLNKSSQEDPDFIGRVILAETQPFFANAYILVKTALNQGDDLLKEGASIQQYAVGSKLSDHQLKRHLLLLTLILSTNKLAWKEAAKFLPHLESEISFLPREERLEYELQMIVFECKQAASPKGFLRYRKLLLSYWENPTILLNRGLTTPLLWASSPLETIKKSSFTMRSLLFYSFIFSREEKSLESGCTKIREILNDEIYGSLFFTEKERALLVQEYANEEQFQRSIDKLRQSLENSFWKIKISGNRDRDAKLSFLLQSDAFNFPMMDLHDAQKIKEDIFDWKKQGNTSLSEPLIDQALAVMHPREVLSRICKTLKESDRLFDRYHSSFFEKRKELLQEKYSQDIA